MLTIANLLTLTVFAGMCILAIVTSKKTAYWFLTDSHIRQEYKRQVGCNKSCDEIVKGIVNYRRLIHAPIILFIEIFTFINIYMLVDYISSFF